MIMIAGTRMELDIWVLLDSMGSRHFAVAGHNTPVRRLYEGHPNPEASDEASSGLAV